MSLYPVNVGAVGPLQPVPRGDVTQRWNALESAYTASGASVVIWLRESTELPTDVFIGHGVEEATGRFLASIRADFDAIRGRYLASRSLAQTVSYDRALPSLIAAANQMKGLMQRALRFQIALERAAADSPIIMRMFARSTWRAAWTSAKNVVLQALNNLGQAIRDAAAFVAGVVAGIVTPATRWAKWLIGGLIVVGLGYAVFRASEAQREASIPPLNPRDLDWDDGDTIVIV